MILTSHADMPGTDATTGVWLSTFTDAYYEFIQQGIEVTVASPRGGRPPIDPLSEAAEYLTPTTERFRNDTIAQLEFGNTWKLAEVDVSYYDAIYIADGHGALWDMMAHDSLGRMLYQCCLEEKPIGMVGHGVAALASLSKLRPGVIAGKQLTCFTDTEEALLKRHSYIPLDLKDWLKKEGADFRQAIIPFSTHVASDGLFITGQNPASAIEVARNLVQELSIELAC